MAPLSTWDGVFTHPYSETASGISNVATEITEADVNEGAIDHALGFGMETGDCNGFAAPAVEGDCPSNSSPAPKSQLFRFPASTNCAAGSITPRHSRRW